MVRSWRKKIFLLLICSTFLYPFVLFFSFFYKAIKDCLSDVDTSEQNTVGDSLLKQSIIDEECLIPDIVGKGGKESNSEDAVGRIIDVESNLLSQGSAESGSTDQMTTTTADQVDNGDMSAVPVTQSILEIVRY